MLDIAVFVDVVSCFYGQHKIAFTTDVDATTKQEALSSRQYQLPIAKNCLHGFKTRA